MIDEPDYSSPVGENPNDELIICFRFGFSVFPFTLMRQQYSMFNSECMIAVSLLLEVTCVCNVIAYS